MTPVILPGFDDGKFKKAERLFLQAVEQSVMPVGAVSDFTLRKAPFQSGLHPNQYRRPDYLDSANGRRFSAWHVHVSFREPMTVPSQSVPAGTLDLASLLVPVTPPNNSLQRTALGAAAEAGVREPYRRGAMHAHIGRVLQPVRALCVEIAVDPKLAPC